MIDRQPAVLDTSFWTVGHRAGVLPYLFRFFVVHVPPAVRREIMAVDPVYPRRVYGYVAMFQAFEELGALPEATPSRPTGRFGLGEAEALAVAEERAWTLLINDRCPSLFAAHAGIATLSVPTFIAYLYEVELLSLTSVGRKLDLIVSFTSPSLLGPVRQAVDRLARDRKEKHQ